MTWRLFDFGARAADQDSAASLLDAALANQDATLQKALGAVVQDYFDAMSARAVVRARGEATQYAQQTLDATRRREVKGVAAMNDTLQANAALAKAHLTKCLPSPMSEISTPACSMACSMRFPIASNRLQSDQ